jgi:hypothetical protein
MDKINDIKKYPYNVETWYFGIVRAHRKNNPTEPIIHDPHQW